MGFGVKRPNAEERKKVVDHYIELVGLTGFGRPIRGSCRAACGSASRSPGLSRPSRTSSSWTSLSAPWTT